MAPADGPLDEETFGKLALDFVGDSILRWDGDRSTQVTFNTTEKGWETNVGTTPPGSMWVFRRSSPYFSPHLFFGFLASPRFFGEHA
eukprot:SAG31_NODE_687_length_12813_cov_2.597216_3_plen_87_part_00